MTGNDSALVKSAIGSFQKLHVERRSIEQEVRTYASRSSKVASAFQKKIFDKALALVGISQEDIRQRQQENDAADKRFLEAIQPRVSTNAEAIAKRQKAARETFQKIHKPHQHSGPNPPGPPPVYDIIETAASVAPFPNAPAEYDVSIAAWNNILRFQLNGGQSHSYEFDFAFIYNPPRDGNLGLFSPVAANGSNWWAAQHGCVEALIEQNVVAELGVIVNNVPQLLDTETILYKYWDKHPGCSSDIGMNIIDQTPIVEYGGNGGVPVSGGKPVVIIVAIYVEFWADDALGGIDFFTSAKQISVPGIVLSVT